jgi:hypothetical protein
MRYRTLFFLAAIVIPMAHASAQSGDGQTLRLARTDVLYRSSGFERESQSIILDDAVHERSIPQAFAMSALIPGLGQVYNKSLWKAGIALVAEAALVTAYVAWKGKGNDGVDDYEAYAHEKWNPARYAQWLNAYSGYTGSDIPLPDLTEEEFMHPEDWTATEKAQVDQLIDDIRDAERQSVYLSTGAGFSHVLPFFGEQQYYELIGKYFQYAPGWEDYEFDPDAQPEDVMPQDAQFYYYAGIHADANDYLRKSSWAGAFVIINHFAAAVEAAVSAKMHNMSLRPRTAMTAGAFGEPVATAGLTLDF